MRRGEFKFFNKPMDVSIEENRWDVTITVTDEGGLVHQFIASADSFYTMGDGIWFGTTQEHGEQE